MLIGCVGHQSSACFKGCTAGVLFIAEATEPKILAVELDPSEPEAFGRVPRYATVARRAALVATPVLHVAGMWDGSEIPTAIIPRAPVDVIGLQASATWLQVENAMVHEDGPSTPIDLGVSSSIALVHAPRMEANPGQIDTIDQGVTLDGATARVEWYADHAHPLVFGGILSLHRESPSRGVVPPDVASIAGASCCLNYTTYQIGEAA